MAWKKGPMPPETWGWGAVVPAGEAMAGGFYFADFHGDHVKIVAPDSYRDTHQLKPHEVAWYDNGLELPPGCQGRAGAAG